MLTLPEPVYMLAQLRLDAALYEPVPCKNLIPNILL